MKNLPRNVFHLTLTVTHLVILTLLIAGLGYFLFS